ncbi:nuclear transport factor 2 family protein [Ectopseudomonas mendocina]|uniref:Nuclear transport factor 2 family protein n=1 Tax=Ectopseudomonas mendocina TaxID=300 RepID=A0ABZ2RDH9_ECTME
MSEFLHRFAHKFASLTADNLDHLGELYSHDVVFQDPLHTIKGLPAVQDYFANLYANVSDLKFTFEQLDTLTSGKSGYLRWTMQFRHPRLNGGNPVMVKGCTYLRWHEKVYLHHDYFDAGAMLYEHLPLAGKLIRWLKGRLA